MTNKAICLETQSYTWPTKEDFIKAMEVYKDYKENGDEGSFTDSLVNLLYLPFKENERPETLQKIDITDADFAIHKWDTSGFFLGLSKISKTIKPFAEIKVDHDVDYLKKGSEPSVFKLTISLKK